MDIVGRTLLGKYKVERLLGQGGMGSVWLAKHLITGRQVAVKILDDRFLANVAVVQRFGREARTASAIQHEGIVEVLDLDMTEEGVPFLVMELLEGESLADRIERRGKLTERELVYLGTQLLDALHAAHERGVIHRDLKPDNVFVVPAGRSGDRVKILDFGISSKSDEVTNKLTVTGSVLGTPHYMSPEQAAGDQDLDRRTDIYATGVLLYECVVGAVPFDAANYNKLLRNILEGKPVSPIERGAMITSQMEAVILRAMHRDRDARPATAAALKAEMLAAAQQRKASMPPGAPEGPTSQGSRPSRTPSAPPATPVPGVATLVQPTAPAVPAVEDPKWDLGSFEAPAPATSSRSSRSRSRLHEPAAAVSGLDDLIPAAAVAKLEIDEGALQSARKPQRSSVPPPSSEPLPAATIRSLSPSSGRISGRQQAITEAAPPAPAAPAGGWSALPPQTQRYIVFGSISLVLFVGAVMAVRWLVRPDSVAEVGTTVGPSIEGPSHDPSRDWVLVQVDGVPPGAELRLDGLPGVNLPLRIRRGTTHSLQIRAPGYVERTIEVRGEDGAPIRADLVPLVGSGEIRH